MNHLDPKECFEEKSKIADLASCHFFSLKIKQTTHRFFLPVDKTDNA